jgi:hypothetical protein
MITNNEKPKSGMNPTEADGPTLVQCPTYRCMAQRDKGGKWRGLFKKELLPEPVTIVPRWH